MKSINQTITEAAKEDYVVCFVGFVDKEGLPIPCTLLVPRTATREFETFAEKEQDNVFVHVVGGFVEY